MTNSDLFGCARCCSFMTRVFDKFKHFADIVWVLGRERDLTAAARGELYNLLYELNFNPDRLILTKHEKCDEFF